MAWVTTVTGERGRRYKVGWREPDRKTRYKTFRRRVDAEAYKTQIEHSKLEGTYVSVSAGKMTLGEFAVRYLSIAKSQVRAPTFARYESLVRLYIIPGLGSRRLSQLSTASIRDFLTGLRDSGKSEATVSHVYRVLRRMLTIAVQESRLSRNPAERLGASSTPRRREPRFLTPDEIARIVAETPARYRALTLLLAYGGLRIGEAVALKMKHLNLLEGRVQVVEAVTEVGGHLVSGGTKTGKSHSVSLPPFLREELTQHVNQFGTPKDPSSFVFTAEGGDQVRASNYRNRIFHPACERAGISPLPRVHDLRHTAVAIAIRAGAHPMQIKEMVGHASITMTFDVYGHLFETLHSQAGAAIDAIFRDSARSLRSAAIVKLSPKPVRSTN